MAQWEVRLRVADRSGAWRIVVSIPTGVSSAPAESLQPMLVTGVRASSLLSSLTWGPTTTIAAVAAAVVTAQRVFCERALLAAAGHESGEENVQIYREAVAEGRVVYRVPHGSTTGGSNTRSLVMHRRRPGFDCSTVTQSVMSSFMPYVQLC